MKQSRPGRTASITALSALLASAALAQGTITIGDLPPGKTVTVTFRATVNGLTNQVLPTISNQGTVKGTNFADVSTDDPGTGTAGDATSTSLDFLSIGDRIWLDAGGFNGTFDAGEGVVGAALTLFADTGTTANELDGSDTVIGTTTSGTDGAYLFTGLAPGAYIVRVDASSFAAAAVLDGKVSIAGAPDPDTDVNSDDNGRDEAMPATNGVSTFAVSLAYNSEPTTDGDADLDTNLSVDLGFVEGADLSMDKSDDGSDALASGTYTYTLEVTNNGPLDSSSSTVTDTLPAGWTFNSSTNASCLGDGGNPETVTCTVGALTATTSTSFTITANVPASAPSGTVTNTADVTGAETDSNSSNDSDTEMTDVVRDADLELDKSDDGTDAVAGSTYDYTLKVTNDGPSDSAGGTVSDTLPTGWTFVSATGGTCVGTAMGFDCTVDPLTVGSMQTFTVTVQVPASATAGTVTNSATVNGTDPDSNSGNDGSSEMTDVVRNADLEMDKTDDGTDAVAGSTYDYTLKVTNNGPSDSAGATVTDTLPTDWTFSSSTNATCVGDAGNPETVTCTIGALTVAAMTSFTITAGVPASATAGSVTNTAAVAGDDPDGTAGNDSDMEPTDVVRDADLAMDKSDDGTDAVAGAAYTYTLKVTNNGPSDSSGATVTDTLPADWTFTSSTNGTCVGDAGNPETVTCTIGALAVGAMTSFTVTASVPSDHAEVTVTNTADVTGSDPDGTAGNDEDTEPTDVVREADLKVTKTESTDPVLAGVGLPGNLTYVVTVMNLGPSDVTGVIVDEDITIPAPDVTVDSVTPSDGTFTPGVAPDGTWDGFDLAAGASATLTVVISVGPSAPFGTDNISNTATLTGTTGGETLVNTGDDSATESTSILVDFDFGDAPDPGFPTALVSDGARHAIVPGGPFLGASVDEEIDGQVSPFATGDDDDGNDDDDGVTFGDPMRAGAMGTEASVDVEASAPGLLDAWVDFDLDGTWDHPGEQIFANEPLVAGINSLTFMVPAGSQSGCTAVRFRLSTAGGLAPDGLASDGEVEDYGLESIVLMDEIEIINRDFSVDSVFEAKETILVGGEFTMPDVYVLDPATLTLRARDSVVLRNGVVVEEGAGLAISVGQQAPKQCAFQP